MNLPCPEPTEWERLLDRQLTEERAESLRLHARACTPCQAQLAEVTELGRALRAPVDLLDAERSVARVLERVRHPTALDQLPERPSTWRRLGLPALALAAGLAGLLVFVARPVPGASEFAARGGTLDERWSRRVGVSFHLVESQGARELSADATVAPDAAYVLRYQNLVAEGTVFLLAFAVDSKGEVHWLYPGHAHAASNEGALELPAGQGAMAESVVLEAPSAGPLRLMAVLRPKAGRVRDVEDLPPAERSAEALRRRWPDAVVEAVSVVVAASP